MAGTLRQNTGIPFNKMRILGSYALVYLVHGSGRYSDDQAVDQKVRAGDLLTLYPNIAHAYGPGLDERWDEIFLVFDGPVLDIYRSRGVLDDTRPVRRFEPIEYWFRKMESIITSARNQSPLLAICKLQQVLAEMRDYEHARDISETDRAWLAQAILLLERDCPAEEFDLPAVADQLGVSYVGFRKKFVRMAGVSPARFRMKAMMERACDLMRHPAIGNREIAARLGFCDEFHFSRRFKQMIGLSPREFRQQMPRE